MAQLTNQAGARALPGIEAPEAGIYEIDPAHSAVEFVARHLMLTKVRGRFGRFEGTINVAEEPFRSSVDVVIDAASVDTGDEKRDGHLRSGDFLNVEEYPTLEFHGTRLEPVGERWTLEGDLTIRGVTRPVTLDVDYEGAVVDPFGNSRIGFSATTEIDREDWGLTWNVALETGGVLVGRKIVIDLTVSAIKKA
ncbi:MAG: YceI family protein [Actinomycetota bacterium]|nr:YceI family protein [Actinomycetota bacterium]